MCIYMHVYKKIYVKIYENICLYCVLNDLYYDRVLIFVGKMSVVDKDILQVIIRDSIQVKPLDVHCTCRNIWVLPYHTRFYSNEAP